jgi:hypothetical protein
LAIPPIDDPTAKTTPSPQAATSSSLDTQPIQNQSGDGKEKDPVVTSPEQSSVRDQVLLVQNQQKYPAMWDSDGKLAGWYLPCDHFVIEEIPEVKYPVLPSYIWRYPGHCTYDRRRSSVCLLQSWEKNF